MSNFDLFIWVCISIHVVCKTVWLSSRLWTVSNFFLKINSKEITQVLPHSTHGNSWIWRDKMYLIQKSVWPSIKLYIIISSLVAWGNRTLSSIDSNTLFHPSLHFICNISVCILLSWKHMPRPQQNDEGIYTHTKSTKCIHKKNNNRKWK